MVHRSLVVSRRRPDRPSARRGPSSPATGHDPSHAEALGAVTFVNSCAPAVQAEFQRGVAMLHSYWFGYAGKTFAAVLERDPSCAMAYWGRALDLLGNMPVGAALPSERRRRLADSRRGAGRAGQDRARGRVARCGARLLPRPRLGVPGQAAVRLQRRDEEDRRRGIPIDVEAQVFYALTLQASASKTRSHLRQPARVRGHPGEGLRRASAASRCHPLHDPRLRLRAAGRRAAFPRRAAMPASPRPCRMRATCRRTSTR